MPIETVDDIVEEIMDRIGTYGACDDSQDDESTQTCTDEHPCRCCAAAELRVRLDAAYEIEGKLKFVVREEVNRG